jgi:hypothetical protein
VQVVACFSHEGLEGLPLKHAQHVFELGVVEALYVDVLDLQWVCHVA